MSKFGETIRQLREAQRLGLREVAELSDITPTYLSRIERGKELPPEPDTIKAIAKVLAADPDILLSLCTLESDRDLVNLVKARPRLKLLLRQIADNRISDEQLERIIGLMEQDILEVPVTRTDKSDCSRKILTTTGS